MRVKNFNLSNINVISTSAPDPVTSGLELYYDPSNPTSYPGSGSTLFDLSPSGVNASLVGSPVDAGNYFTFTGGGAQNLITGNLAGLYSGWQHTLELWIRPTTQCQIFSDTGIAAIAGGYHATGLEFYSTDPFTTSNAMLWNGAVTRVGGGITPINNWYQYVRVYNGSNTAYAYVNKVKSSPETTITWTPPSPGWYLIFGAIDTTNFATSTPFKGDIGVIRLYNRVLSQAEITQNYDADKSKYGL